MRRLILISLLILLTACDEGQARSPTARPLTAHTPGPAQGAAPADQPLKLGVWSAGRQSAVGSAYTYSQTEQPNPSPVWFGITDGALTLGAYPTIDQANLKELRPLLLTPDGSLFDLTRTITQTITRPEPRLPFWELVAADPEGRWQVTTRVIADPQQSSIVAQWALQVNAGDSSDYRLFLYIVPALGNSGDDDQALAAADGLVGAVDERHKVAMALRSSAGWDAASAGYLQRNDGLIDLEDGKLDWEYTSAGPSGRVALTTELGPAEIWTVAIGFGADLAEADSQARASLTRPFKQIRAQYLDGWRSYVEQLSELEQTPAEVRDLVYFSAAQIKLHEDKRHRGAVVDSTAVPWGSNQADDAEQGGYRRVSVPTLYHAALALLAAGDPATVQDIVRYLDETLQKPDGSFPQNAYVNGKANLNGLQLDQVGAPILIAWQLNDLARYQSLIKPAADFIVKSGPQTPQERWGEQAGYSPSTLATTIAALVCAADLAERSGDSASHDQYLKTASEWRTQLAGWLFTTNGPLGDGRYLLRISQGDPNAERNYALNQLSGSHDQRTIIDAGFLELARLGVLTPTDTLITASLPELDAALKVETPAGPAWRRYPFDTYGELSRSDLNLTTGHPWTLLTGERGMYELQAGNLAEARRLLLTLAAFAGPGGLISEQVWEDTGQGTQSATPLVWSHAELVVLARSVSQGKPFDTPEIVRQTLQQ